MIYPPGFPGNVIKGHGRDHTILMFIKFAPPREATLIGTEVSACKEFVRYLTPLLTFNKEQLDQRENRDEDPYTNFMSLGITRRGFDRLEIAAEMVPKDPKSEKYFNVPMFDGMISNDFWIYPGSSERGFIEPGFRILETGAIHAVLILANDNLEKLYLTARQISSSREFIGCVASYFSEYGAKDSHGSGPFGFQDNISNEDEPDEIYQLTKVDDTAGLIDEERPLGTFMVYQKIRVNKSSFEVLVQDIASQIELPALNPRNFSKTEFAEAYLIGRFRDGTPLLAADQEEDHVEKQDFDYFVGGPPSSSLDDQHLKCPFSSHIRSANPRGFLHKGPKKQHAQIMRRGLNYSYPSISITGEGSTIGLHFISYQKSVTALVQIMKRMGRVGGGVDASFYRLTDAAVTAKFSRVWGQPDEIKVPLNGKEVSQLMGGEIFFFPAKHYLDFLLSLCGAVV